MYLLCGFSDALDGWIAQWGILHTNGNKLAGLLLFVGIPICVYMGRYPAYVVIPLFVAALLSSVDETFVLLTRAGYDPDAKGFLWERFRGKKA